MVTLNAKGKACPMPVVMAKRQLEKGSTFAIEVDNITAVENLKRLAESEGVLSDMEQTEDGVYTVTFIAASIPVIEKEPPLQEGCAVFIGKDCVGAGSPELGASLMKMFLYTLAQSDSLPESVLLMNSGVKLASENAETAEHLKTLAEKGVSVLVCGTCLNYYGLADSLRAGSVSNMYDILLRMQKAKKVMSV